MRPLDNRRSEPDTGPEDALWPASFSHRPAARTAAHALAGLVVEFALLLAYACTFWNRFEPGRPTGVVDLAAVFVAVSLTVPMLLMFCALIMGLNKGGVIQRVLTGLGWVCTVVVHVFVLVLIDAERELLSERHCVVSWPAIPGGVDLETAAALCVMAGLGTGVLVSWAVWNVTRRRGRRIGRVALYGGWLTVVAIDFPPAGLPVRPFRPHQYATPTLGNCPA